jgi:hypothetical protein
MMSAILKLKSDGAQALLTAVLLAGCALNVALVWALAVRAGDGSIGVVQMRAQPVAAAPVPAGSTQLPAATGGFLAPGRQKGRDVATGGRVYPLHALRPS